LRLGHVFVILLNQRYIHPDILIGNKRHINRNRRCLQSVTFRESPESVAELFGTGKKV
jgi:hypothetical protein